MFVKQMHLCYFRYFWNYVDFFTIIVEYLYIAACFYLVNVNLPRAIHFHTKIDKQDKHFVGFKYMLY